MRRRGTILAATVLLASVPGLALAASTSFFSGNAIGDPAAKIRIKIKTQDNGKRKVTRIVTRGLPYAPPTFGCSGPPDRTPRGVLTGRFRVRSNGEFRVVGQSVAADPINNGELKVIGDATRRRITGTMRFTFGKDGCTTGKLPFKAKRQD